MLERICSTCFSYMYLHELVGWLKCPSCGGMKKENKSMISLQEMMGPNNYDDLSDELKANAIEQLRRVNLFRTEYGIPMIVDSGYRTPEHNAAIGGAKDSSHCTCQAIDFRDTDNKLKEFIAKDPTILDRCDLYMEDPSTTTDWIHLQSRVIPSGKRIFMP